MPSTGDVVNILLKIEGYLKQLKFQERIKKIFQKAKSFFITKEGSMNHQTLEKVFNIFKTIYEYLPQLTSSDPSKLLLGLTSIVSSVSCITGLGGPVVPALCGVLSLIFSYFGGTTFTMRELVENEIRRVFARHSYETLLEEADDLHLTYQLAFDFLNPLEEDPSDFSEHDITNISTHMNIFQGSKFLRKLGKLIQELAKEDTKNDSKRKTEKASEAMQFIDLYINLALLRDAILWNFFTITNSTAHSQRLAGGVKRVIDSFDEQDRKALGMFLKPTNDYIYITSVVREDECNLLMKFLERKNLFPDQGRLDSRQFCLNSARWPNWHAVRSIRVTSLSQIFDNFEFVRGSKTAARPESMFFFEKIHSGKNHFYITQKGRPGEKMSMTDDRWVVSKKGLPDSECVWKAIEMENGKYVFSPLNFPGYFMGMSKRLDGSIAGYLGGYNEQCHWFLWPPFAV